MQVYRYSIQFRTDVAKTLFGFVGAFGLVAGLLYAIGHFLLQSRIVVPSERPFGADPGPILYALEVIGLGLMVVLASGMAVAFAIAIFQVLFDVEEVSDE